MKNGIVYFVGAGPGDPELLTIKGRRVLQTADVVIFDRLVNPILLTEVRDGAKLVYCGKQPCQHFLRQEDIQKELLIHARKGKQVVRLKGGDPAVFGRVGEEAELLSENHIEYEIVPGITSGIAAPLYAGATITHREHSRSFAIVSGHGKDGKPEAEWQSLAKGVDTVVFYMGVKYVKLITEELVNAGKDKQTAVLVIQWGTYSKQRTIEGTLATIAKQIEREGITNPAIIVVGNVVKLRKKLQWFDQRVLSGKGILFPTKKQTNLTLIEQLRRQGADVYQHPTLREQSLVIENFHSIIGNLHMFSKIVFLSSQSVKEFIKGLVHNNMDLRMIQADFFAADDEVKETLRSFGCQSTISRRDSKWDKALVVGGKEDIHYDFFLLPNSIQVLITHEYKVTDNEVEAFTRLIEEEHVNVVILTDRRAANDFANVLARSRLTSKSLEQFRIICRGKETMNVLHANSILADVQLDAKSSDNQLIESLVDKYTLAIEG